MKPRTISLALITGFALAIGSAAFADQAGADRPAQPQQPQAGRPDGSGADAQRERQADDQIDQVLAKIAEDPKTAADKLFLLTAAIHNQAEIELAKEVAQKSQNEQVRKTAQQLAQRLEKTQQELQQTAQAVGLPLPRDLGRSAVQQVQIIAALPADQVDRQYSAHVQADNAQDASEYQSEAQIAQDPQVRKFAQDQMAGIREGSQDANNTAQAVGIRGDEAQPAGAHIPARGTDGK